MNTFRNIHIERSSAIFVLPCLIDLAFIVYWFVVAIDAVPEKYMFRDYDTDIMVAWNWSFFPLDILVSVTGLAAAILWQRRSHAWLAFMTISLSLMFCAGLQAITFWWLAGDFDLIWWAMNLFLMIVPFGSVLPLYRNFNKLARGRN